MSDDYTLLTPENVDLRFDMAGLGSRGAAALIDYTILGVGYFILALGGLFVLGLLGIGTDGSAFGSRDGASIIAYAIIALVVLVMFFGWWGYFILGEMIWNGQSIGKRRLGLRVVRAGGQPISITASLIRNLLRVVDQFLFIGVLVMIVDSRSRRLGDLAAGTVVIREPRNSPTKDLTTALRPVDIPAVSEQAVDAFPNPERLAIGHYMLLRDYFARRSGMTARSADLLASDLASRLAGSLDVEPSAVGDPVTFLATAARAYEIRRRHGDSF
jgi:uncharacterized RDD family membrane protein YckC